MSAPARGRHQATKRSARGRVSALVLAGLAAVVGIALVVPATGSYALWNSTTSVSAGSIQSGSLTAAASISPSLDVAYSSSTASRTGGFTVTNRGTAAASYAIAVALRSGSDAVLAKSIAVVAWKTTSGECATPVSPATGTWSAFPALSGTLGAGAAQSYCVRTTLGTVAGIASGSAVNPTITSTLKIGGWGSSAAAQVTQTFTDDAKPSAPTGLTASSTTTSSTRLGWSASSDNVGVKDYLVYRGATLVATVAAPVATFTDSGLIGGTNYSYTVKARDAAGNVSAASAALLVKTLASLSCESPNGWMATFRWPTPAGEQSTLKYALYLNGVLVPNTADGWNSYVQVPGVASAYLDTLPAGAATVEVRQILPNGTQTSMGTGIVVLGTPNYRTYLCG